MLFDVCLSNGLMGVMAAFMRWLTHQHGHLASLADASLKQINDWLLGAQDG